MKCKVGKSEGFGQVEGERKREGGKDSASEQQPCTCQLAGQPTTALFWGRGPRTAGLPLDVGVP